MSSRVTAIACIAGVLLVIGIASLSNIHSDGSENPPCAPPGPVSVGCGNGQTLSIHPSVNGTTYPTAHPPTFTVSPGGKISLSIYYSSDPQVSLVLSSRQMNVQESNGTIRAIQANTGIVATFSRTTVTTPSQEAVLTIQVANNVVPGSYLMTIDAWTLPDHTLGIGAPFVLEVVS